MLPTLLQFICVMPSFPALCICAAYTRVYGTYWQQVFGIDLPCGIRIQTTRLQQMMPMIHKAPDNSLFNIADWPKNMWGTVISLFAIFGNS